MENQKNESGFTLVEPVVSVVLLGVSLTTLIGMQINYAETYLDEEFRTRSAMYSQYIMALIEVSEQPPETGTDSGRLENYLKDIDYFNDDFEVKEEIPLDGWTYNLNVTSIDVLELEDAMRRIELTISWGASEREEYKVIYYMKTNASLNSGN